MGEVTPTVIADDFYYRGIWENLSYEIFQVYGFDAPPELRAKLDALKEQESPVLESAKVLWKEIQSARTTEVK